MTLKQTLADLVAINSVSSLSNEPIVEYLAERCQRLGLQVELLPYDDQGVKKINLVARSLSGSSHVNDIELTLVGHTDTVPFDPNWKDALKLTEEDGKLFGRGASDTKAFIAASFHAVESIDLNSLRRPLALVFTADEEIGLIGAKRLAQSRPFRTRHAIVGEPTSLRPMRAGKGYCLAEITVKGREAHSAYPAFGSSAVFGAARLIVAIERAARELEAQRHDAFDPPFTTLNVGLVKGGTAKNVIAGECKFTLEWRPIPGQDASHVLDFVNQVIEDEKKQDPKFLCEVDAARADSGFETAPAAAIVAALEQLSGNPSGTVAFGTEAAQLTELGAEAVVFGPGDIREAHRTGEFVPVSELETCAQVLQKAIERFCF